MGLRVYADADYANESDDRRSVSGVAGKLGNTVIHPAVPHSILMMLIMFPWAMGLSY